MNAGDRDRRQQTFRIGIQGVPEPVFFVAIFYHTPGIHDQYFIGNMLDYRHTVGHKHIGQPPLLLHIPQKTENLRSTPFRAQ